MAQISTNTQEKIYEDEDKTLGVFVYPEFEYYYIYSRNHLKIKEYKEGYTQLLDIAGNEYHFNKLVFSLDSLISTPIMGRAWFVTYFAPSFYKKADKNLTVAIVKPKNKFEAIAVDIMLNSLPKMGVNVKIKLFDDEQEAIKWIENPIFE